MLLVPQASSLTLQHFNFSSLCNGTFYRRNEDTDILSQVVCKNCGNWNGYLLLRRLILFCSFPQELEGMLLQSSLLHGQLALFQLYLESLTPTENSLVLMVVGIFQSNLLLPYSFPKITTFGGNHCFWQH